MFGVVRWFGGGGMGLLASAALMDEEICMLNTRVGRAAEMPTGDGIGDARSLAKFYADLLGGGIESLRLSNAVHVRTGSAVQG